MQPTQPRPVLSTLRARREWKKSPGLVKLHPGIVDIRAVNLVAPWRYEQQNDYEDAAVVVGSDEDVADQDQDQEDPEDQPEEVDEVVAQPTQKRKRHIESTGKRTAKRVSFMTPPTKNLSVASKRTRR